MLIAPSALGGGQLRANPGDAGFLGEPVALEGRAQRHQVLLGLCQRFLRGQQEHLLVRVAEHEDHRVPRHHGAGAQRAILDAAADHGGDVADVFGNQRPGRAHVAYELAALDGIDDDLGPRDGWRPGLEPAQRHRQHHGGDEAPGDEQVPLGLPGRFSLDVHETGLVGSVFDTYYGRTVEKLQPGGGVGSRSKLRRTNALASADRQGHAFRRYGHPPEEVTAR